VADRGYRLLLGLRQARAWSTIRPRAFQTALDALRTSFRAVVADVDPDMEGEADGGSIDVEERNVMARTTLLAADAVVVVGAPGMKGAYSLTQVITALTAHGVAGERVVPVINRAPRGIRARSEIADVVSALVASPLPRPLFIGERHVDNAFRDLTRLPDALVLPITDRCSSLTARADVHARAQFADPVQPGSLGRWSRSSSRNN